MKALNKQALRQLATDAHELGIIKRYTKGIEANNRFVAIATPLTVLALLDELEAVQKTSAARLEAIDRTHKMFQREKDRADAAEKRIAELEAREVMLPEPFKLAKSSSGLTYYYADEVDAAIQAAGIGVKGE
ncbi:hypothetical protein DOV11_04135 [Salmonella enterica]|nr:hypothetical protein [Salmonella enterica]EAU0855619.1 hypothetical protein [Salmonella enterica]